MNYNITYAKSDSVESTPKLHQKSNSKFSKNSSFGTYKATSTESLKSDNLDFTFESEFEQIEEEGLTTSLG